ncbi:hypothetical protein Q3G72_008852 [Acer saccharum]|nr:hypothetical protein Q3G72_008852 [Acer saccharum]
MGKDWLVLEKERAICTRSGSETLESDCSRKGYDEACWVWQPVVPCSVFFLLLLGAGIVCCLVSGGWLLAPDLS